MVLWFVIIEWFFRLLLRGVPLVVAYSVISILLVRALRAL